MGGPLSIGAGGHRHDSLTLLIARMLWGDARTESFAALILSTTVGFFALARLLTPDMTLTFWITAAAACFRREPPRRTNLGMVVLCGDGIRVHDERTDGVRGPLSAVAGWQWARRRENSPEKKLPWIRGICLALGIGLSWFIAVTLIYPETASYFLRYELLERFGSHAHGRAKPFWFFAPVLVVGLMPWTFFLPASCALPCEVVERLSKRRHSSFSSGGFFLRSAFSH
jgi:4-amino-4-deoxy-L-arabinose transferase-like glycosyltransferase